MAARGAGAVRLHAMRRIKKGVFRLGSALLFCFCSALFVDPDGHFAWSAIRPEIIGHGRQCGRRVFGRFRGVELVFPTGGVTADCGGHEHWNATDFRRGILEGEFGDWRKAQRREIRTVVAFLNAVEHGAALQGDFPVILPYGRMGVDAFDRHRQEDVDLVIGFPCPFDIGVAAIRDIREGDRLFVDFDLRVAAPCGKADGDGEVAFPFRRQLAGNIFIPWIICFCFESDRLPRQRRGGFGFGEQMDPERVVGLRIEIIRQGGGQSRDVGRAACAAEPVLTPW